MSDGIKAMWDDIHEEERKVKLNKFMRYSDGEKLDAIVATIDKLDRFIESNPSLTRHQWALINDAMAEMKSLVK